MYRWMMILIVLVAAAAGGLWLVQRPTRAADAPIAPPNFDQAFADRWYDGRAELAGYTLTYPRYGQLRKGSAVTIFVTEHTSAADRVKPEPPGDDAFRVMKLNLVEDFPTGLYDYNLMTSVFVTIEPALDRPAGAAAKVSLTAQEWCGHVYHHLLFDADKVRQTWHSYFDGEADGRSALTRPAGSLAEDALFHWARGFAAPALAPGESIKLRLLRSLAVARLNHVPVEWDHATLTRQAETRTITVPAGTFEVQTFTAKVESAAAPRTWTFHVENAPPRRIVQWSRSDGYAAKLLGSKRLAYWKLNGTGDEKLLEQIGLTPRAPRSP
jgi:hypothetical protein